MDLPPPWELRESSRYPGRCFYYNTDTHESSWFRPIPYPGHRIAWPPAVFVLHILVRDSDEAQEKIIGLRQSLIEQNRSFVDVARSSSEDTATAGKGGCLGWVQRGQMPKEFEDAAWELRIGEMSLPVHTSQGWHLILRRG